MSQKKKLVKSRSHASTKTMNVECTFIDGKSVRKCVDGTDLFEDYWSDSSDSADIAETDVPGSSRVPQKVFSQEQNSKKIQLAPLESKHVPEYSEAGECLESSSQFLFGTENVLVKIPVYEHNVDASISYNHNCTIVHPAETDFNHNHKLGEEMTACIQNDDFIIKEQSADSVFSKTNSCLQKRQSLASCFPKNVTKETSWEQGDVNKSSSQKESLVLKKDRKNEDSLSDCSKPKRKMDIYVDDDNSILKSDSVNEKNSTNRLKQDAVFQKSHPSHNLLKSQCSLNVKICSAPSRESEEDSKMFENNTCNESDSLPNGLEEFREKEQCLNCTVQNSFDVIEEAKENSFDHEKCAGQSVTMKRVDLVSQGSFNHSSQIGTVGNEDEMSFRTGQAIKNRSAFQEKSQKQVMKSKLKLQETASYGNNYSPSRCPRRSSRNRIRPLEFWRNERLKIRFTESGEIECLGIHPGTEVDVVKQNSVKVKANPNFLPKPHLKKRKVLRPIHNVPTSSSHENSLKKDITVYDCELNEDVRAKLIAPFRSLNWETDDTHKSSKGFSVAKSFVFDGSAFGYMRLEAMKSKGPQHFDGHDVIFSVLRGKIKAKVNRTFFIVQELDTFVVPRGNSYSFMNIQDSEALLSFMSTNKYILEELQV